VALGLIDPAVQPAPRDGGLAERVDRFERSALHDALTRHGGLVAAVCEELELPRKTLYDRLARHGLRPAEYRASARAQ